MRFLRPRSKLAILAVVAVLAAAGWLILKPSPSNTSTQTANPISTAAGQSTTGSTSGIAVVETADFKYEIPIGWVQMQKEILGQLGATSGIARVSNTSAVFKTAISSLTPKDDAELKNNALNDIKKNAPHFALLSSVATKVDSKSGQVFTYSFTDSDGKNKIRQQLSAIPNKGKTFFLLASSLDSDFDKQSGEFKKILASFHFK